MKYSLLVLVLLFVGSCSKHSLLNKESQIDDYFLNFDIKEIDYQNTKEVDSFRVKATQSLGFKLDFEEVTNDDYHRIPFNFYGLEPSVDSLVLVGNIRYLIDVGSKFGEEMIDIEFFLEEDKSNLIQVTDTTYKYISNKVFFDQLTELEWGNKAKIASSDASQLLLTLPFITQDWRNEWDLNVLSTSGFYFDHEQLTFDKVEYDEEADAIQVSGNFDVELKIMSCGFYSFFSITNAEFKALIK